MSSIGEIELLRAMAAPRVVLALVFGFLATLTVLTSWAGFVTERSRCTWSHSSTSGGMPCQRAGSERMPRTRSARWVESGSLAPA